MKLLLIHDEMLNDTLPVFESNAALPRVFVFDPAFIAREGWTLKRVQFVADCVSEMTGVRVFHGALLDVLRELGATALVTQRTPNRAIERWIDATQQPVIWHDEPAFAHYDGKLTRFTAYWKSIAPQWFSKEEVAAEEIRSAR
jgi:deoxyribodipyrimidine photo-lyase